MGIKAHLTNDLNPIWSEVLKKHRLKNVYIELLYTHNVHQSRRNKNWVRENITRLRRSMNGPFLYSFNLTKALEEHPEVTKQTWLDINFEIQEKNNALK